MRTARPLVLRLEGAPPEADREADSERAHVVPPPRRHVQHLPRPQQAVPERRIGQPRKALLSVRGVQVDLPRRLRLSRGSQRLRCHGRHDHPHIHQRSPRSPPIWAVNVLTRLRAMHATQPKHAKAGGVSGADTPPPRRAWLELVVRPSRKGHSMAAAAGGYSRTYLTPTTCASRLWCGSVCRGVTCAARRTHACDINLRRWFVVRVRVQRRYLHGPARACLSRKGGASALQSTDAATSPAQPR